MSKLEELIQQYCPDGVEYKPIGDYLKYEQPTKYLVESTKYDDSYPTPVLTAGQSFILGYTKETDGIYKASKDSPVIIFDDFTTSLHWVEFSFKVKSSAMKMLTPVDETKALFRYLYYCMKNIMYVPGDHTRQWIGTYSQFEIPIPPLPVQEEIVRVLDTFTELQAELQAELQKRLQQYNYYRDNLIQKHCVGVEYKTLCELGTFYSGLTGKSKDDFSGGNAKFITYVNIFNHPSLETDVEEKVKIAEGEKQNTVQYGDMLFTGSSETPDECGMCSVLTHHTDEEMYLNSFCFGFRFNDLNDKSPDFMKHLFRSTDIRKKICKTANGVTRFNVSKKEFAKIEIPLLPLDVQVKLAAILDRFFTLTTDLTAGLPAEIEKRRQQYEYYRDKLLTFKRKEA